MKSNELNLASHYHESYFNDYQKTMGEFGGKANKFMFEHHISFNDVVLDFGCGGGFLLKNLFCRRKIGIEINSVARDYCNEITGIDCFESLNSVPDKSVDVVISSHCLEHTPNPFELVSMLYEKLKVGGKIIIVVPLESYQHKWVSGDVNNHLYSFSPMNLGNILQGNRFTDIKVKPIYHKWVPFYETVTKYFGFKFFHFLSRLYGRIPNIEFIQIMGIGFKS